MMQALEKLDSAKKIIERGLEDLVISLSLNLDFRRIHLILRDGVNIYIVYNNHDEYSYAILFSRLELDRCRFDNYDKNWKVKTKPHYLHPRYKKEAILSNMVGDPEEDIPLLCCLLKSRNKYWGC